MYCNLFDLTLFGVGDEAKQLKRLHARESNAAILNKNLMAVFNSVQPAFTASMQKMDTQASIDAKRPRRGQPLSTSAKQRIINMAYTPIRGLRNAMRCFNVGAAIIHESLHASAMLLHLLMLLGVNKLT